jgi:hypothetical protein
MAKLEILKGSTGQLVEIFIPDSSVSTGAGRTGLVYNTAGLVAYYHRNADANPISIPLTAGLFGAGVFGPATWQAGSFKEISATNMPGMYQFGIPNGALAVGSRSVVIMLKGATNMSPVAIEIQLVINDPENYMLLRSGSHTGAVIPTVTTLTNDAGITQAGADKVWGSASRALTAGVTVTTNSDKTGYALTAGERTSVADALLGRTLGSGGSAQDARTVEQALRILRNKWSISGSTLTVTTENDTTTAWTSAVTEAPGANPISGSNPT